MCSLTKLETSSPNNVFAGFQRALFHEERKQVCEIILKPVCLSVQHFMCLSVFRLLKQLIFTKVVVNLTHAEVFPDSSIFRRVQKNCRKRLLASTCPSVSPHGTTLLPLEELLRKLIFEHFQNICRENSSFIKIEQVLRVLYMETNIHFNHISLSSSQNNECFRQTLQRKSIHTLYVQYCFSKVMPFMR